MSWLEKFPKQAIPTPVHSWPRSSRGHGILSLFLLRQEDRVSESFVGVKFNEEFLSVDIKGRYYSGGPLKHGRGKMEGDPGAGCKYCAWAGRVFLWKSG